MGPTELVAKTIKPYFSKNNDTPRTWWTQRDICTLEIPTLPKNYKVLKRNTFQFKWLIMLCYFFSFTTRSLRCQKWNSATNVHLLVIFSHNKFLNMRPVSWRVICAFCAPPCVKSALTERRSRCGMCVVIVRCSCRTREFSELVWTTRYQRLVP